MTPLWYQDMQANNRLSGIRIVDLWTCNTSWNLILLQLVLVSSSSSRGGGFQSSTTHQCRPRILCVHLCPDTLPLLKGEIFMRMMMWPFYSAAAGNEEEGGEGWVVAEGKQACNRSWNVKASAAASCGPDAIKLKNEGVMPHWNRHVSKFNITSSEPVYFQ